MTGHDLPEPDEDDTEAVEQHRIRYNPTSKPASSRLDTADSDRIRYNPSRVSTEDNDG